MGRLSGADVRARLSATELPDDPTRVDLEAATEDWRPGFRERLADRLAPAAVLIPIVERREGLAVLFTCRSAALAHHAGQVSFPGGRMEAHDADLVATALRETREELGLGPSRVEVAGFLSSVPTLSGYAVTPVVGLLAGSSRLTLDRAEVASAFEVPLGYLLDSASQRRRAGDEDRVAYPIEFHFQGHRIWGVTASIVVALREALAA